MRAWNDGIDRNVKPNLIAYSKFAQWNTDNWELACQRPDQWLPADEPSKVRILTASSINGNAKENWLDFMAPVRIEGACGQIDLINAGKTRYWIEEKKITSSAPVDGTFKELKANRFTT